jgi:hypothetical protein
MCLDVCAVIHDEQSVNLGGKDAAEVLLFDLA